MLPLVLALTLAFELRQPPQHNTPRHNHTTAGMQNLRETIHGISVETGCEDAVQED